MIIVGTVNKRKCAVALRLFTEFTQSEQIVTPFKAESQVPTTPWEKETFDGARNRAKHCQTRNSEADFYVGLESGLTERYGHIFEEAWACVLTKKGKEYLGYSSGLKVPDYITDKMKREQLQHYEVMDILDQEAKRIDNDDTWGTYSSKLLLRDVSLEEALRNALVQIFAPDSSYYKMEIREE